jgi:hypothetical protein
MKRLSGKQLVVCGVMLSWLAISAAALAQDPQYGPPPAPDTSPGWHQFSNPPSNYPPPGQAPDQGPAPVVPPRVRLQAGTFVTVRVDQMLSSDKNAPGDGFSATLTRPLVADGVVVAQVGQMVGGRVVEAQKAGRVKGVSRLGVEIDDLTLVDGQQLPVRTELTNLRGPTSNGRDAAAVAGTTMFGAAVGGAAALGPGAAIGAGAGLIASTVGVLLTRGRPTVIYPESLLTFRLAHEVTISTERAPEAFRYVGTPVYGRPPAAPGQYGPQAQYAPPARSGWNCLGYGWPAPPVAAAPVATPPPYYYYPYPYYLGPSFTFWYGPRFYRGFYGYRR